MTLVLGSGGTYFVPSFARARNPASKCSKLHSIHVQAPCTMGSREGRALLHEEMWTFWFTNSR